MGLLESALICVGLFLLFPKGFKYLVGTWVGAMTGAFLWGLAFIGIGFAGLDPSWAVMGWSFLGFVATGIIVGCILAAHG
mgnify:CR=1 FL=1